MYKSMMDSMKKGGPKKKIKAEIIPYERKLSIPAIAKGSKEQIEKGAATTKRVGIEMQDKSEGNAEFGKDYEDLGLKFKTKGIKRVGDDLERDEKGNVKFRRTFTNSGGDEGVTETVTKEYGGDLLKVRRTAPKAYGSGTETKDFLETIQERKKRMYEEGKSRVLDMMRKAQNQKPKEPTRYMSDENVSRLAEALKKNKNKQKCKTQKTKKQ